MPSKREQVIGALLAAIRAAVPAAVVERDADSPDRVQAGGHVVVRDQGDGETEETIGLRTWWHQHLLDVELYARAVPGVDRFAALDGLQRAIDGALAADRTLGGVIHGCDWRIDSVQDAGGQGAETVRAALLVVTCEYQSVTPLG